MAKGLDFNTLKKKFIPITLKDENKTKLLLTTPTKTVLDSFLNIKNLLDSDEVGEEILNEMYSVIAKIMSVNIAGTKITPDQLSECMDFEDIIVFIQFYTEFIREVTSSKN